MAELRLDVLLEVILLGDAVGLTTIAEGIENVEPFPSSV
jgi:hypothetical protein